VSSGAECTTKSTKDTKKDVVLFVMIGLINTVDDYCVIPLVGKPGQLNQVATL
jgi:hypothetical protein